MALYGNYRSPSSLEMSEAWLGSSEMADRVLAFDWQATPLGPMERWPKSLKSAVAVCLHSPVEMAVYWGPDLNCIYNDAERDALGKLHPGALGLPARELLRDSWDLLGPQLQSVMECGECPPAEDQTLTLNRCGRPELPYLTYSCSPIPDDAGAVGGLVLIAHDPISRRLGEPDRARRDGELRGLLEKLRAAQRRAAAAADAERRRIERDLHDGAQQRLMAIRLELGLVEERLPNEPDGAMKLLADLRGELDEALQELRELAHGLYPALLATDGLEAALRSTARHSPLPVSVETGPMTRAPRAIESTAYFCCLEALQNATKHAGPGARATIQLRMADHALRFRVQDDGAGFDPEVAPPGQGLVNLRDRLESIGGTVTISSVPGAGTTVTGEIPLPGTSG